MNVSPVVVDLSHWNTIPQSLEAAAAAGVRGVIHKLTEGTSVIDSTAPARFHLAGKAGMLWGLYHFVRPGRIRDQLDFFLEKATELEVIDSGTLLALDYEDSRVALDDVLYFMDELERRTGRSPALYTGNTLKELAPLNPTVAKELRRFRLWLAQYAAEPVLPKGWESWWLWQYSDGDKGPDPHTVPGIRPPVDCNWYAGPPEILAAEWSGAPIPAVAEAPEPAPVPS